MALNEFHFCMNCGARLTPNDNFCGNCGVKVGETKRRSKIEIQNFLQYKNQIYDLKNEFDIKEKRARDLSDKVFDKANMTYTKFDSSLNNIHKLFYEQMDAALNIIDLSASESEMLENELNNKISLLKSFISKLNDLIDEFVIHISSNGENSEEIQNVFEDMESLIDSVKYYE